MGTRGGNTLVYRCAHGHSWREIPLFTDVRNRTRTRFVGRQCKDHALFQSVPQTDYLTRTFCANAGLPADNLYI